jgi:hypothetical protein
MRMGDSRKVPAVGSHANGKQPPHASPRVSITWPPWMLIRLRREAAIRQTSFAEVVRQCVKETLKP